MANRTQYPIVGVKNELFLITAELTGAGAADMVNAESGDFGAGEISSAVRSATGKFTLTLRKSWPQLKAPLAPVCVGTTDGLVGMFSAIDMTAGTASLELYVGSVATDPAATDTIYVAFLVRNTSLNT